MDFYIIIIVLVFVILYKKAFQPWQRW